MREQIKRWWLKIWHGIETVAELFILTVTVIFEAWTISLLIIFIIILWHLGYLW